MDNDIKEKYPDTAAAWAKFHNLFKVQPDVCGQTCAFLAAGRGKMLKGRYFDCEQNIQEVIDAGEPGLQGCYEMKVDFAGGLPNDGGTAFSVVEKSN